MSYADYMMSKAIVDQEPSFNAIIMAAMRKADTYHGELLQRCFPSIWWELDQRYNLPGGHLDPRTDPDYKATP